MNEGPMTETHAHEVMEMMISSGKSYNRESLVQAIEDKFGKEVRFHTCSADGLTPEALIDFLAAKGKFTGTPEAFSFNPGRVCQGH